MDMSKVSGNENINNLFPRNNQNLYDQLKLCIISDYFPKTLSKMPKGTMEFFIRDGELAINYHIKKANLRGPVPINTSVGMSRGKLLSFLMLVEDNITAQPTIEYGSIIINYELLEDGDIDGDIEFKTQVNHRRR
ncbi:hypothetical protein EHV15_35105 [Paenibacillus oralis]|uniref:Uncharacterized protein n=1 Tax=Paenibacillus oralis TaxID=2490856 RepID=A0A3P3TA37_9BACL|nr:hypothetical protein [Paenibacillus oralis]RRJ54820.1 hypothetical protein EHV15_35105 [Paenibacillus oralis]